MNPSHCHQSIMKLSEYFGGKSFGLRQAYIWLKIDGKNIVKAKLPFKMSEMRVLTYQKTSKNSVKCYVQNTYFSAPIEVQLFKPRKTSVSVMSKAPELHFHW